MGIWDKKLVIIFWFYVNNCVFEHMANNFFRVNAPPPFEEACPSLPSPKVKVLEPTWRRCELDTLNVLSFQILLPERRVVTSSSHTADARDDAIGGSGWYECSLTSTVY